MLFVVHGAIGENRVILSNTDPVTENPVTTMHSRRTRYLLHKLRVGYSLHCPVCEQGSLFEDDRRYALRSTCAYCESRFARGSGDAIGGVYINVALAEFTAVAGFFLVHNIFNPPVMLQLFIWVPYVILFSLLFYRHARGLWITLMYFMGGIYPDLDITREYVRPQTQPTSTSAVQQDHDDA